MDINEEQNGHHKFKFNINTLFVAFLFLIAGGGGGFSAFHLANNNADGNSTEILKEIKEVNKTLGFIDGRLITLETGSSGKFMYIENHLHKLDGTVDNLLTRVIQIESWQKHYMQSRN